MHANCSVRELKLHHAIVVDVRLDIALYLLRSDAVDAARQFSLEMQDVVDVVDSQVRDYPSTVLEECQWWSRVVPQHCRDRLDFA